MQRFCVLGQVPLDLFERTRPILRAQRVQKFVRRGPEGFRCLPLRLRLVGCGILAELHAGIELVRGLARIGKALRGCLAERHAPLLGAELVLKDEVPRTAFPHAQSKTRNIIVEKNRLAFAVWQRLSAHRRSGQFHGSPSIWEDHGKIARVLR